jgi:hypothetical protein
MLGNLAEDFTFTYHSQICKVNILVFSASKQTNERTGKRIIAFDVTLLDV